MADKKRWTRSEWDLFIARVVSNGQHFKYMLDRIRDAMNALPENRRRDPASVLSSTYPWKKLVKEQEAVILNQHLPVTREYKYLSVASDDQQPAAPAFDITKIPDAEFYAEVARRLSLFVLQNASSSVLNLLKPSATDAEAESHHLSRIFGREAVPSHQHQSESDESAVTESGTAAPTTTSSVPAPSQTRTKQHKVVFVGVYGKNAVAIKSVIDPYLKSSFFDPDSSVSSVIAACTAADVIYLCIERVPHKLKDALTTLKGRKEIQYQKGGTSALLRSVVERFSIPHNPDAI